MQGVQELRIACDVMCAACTTQVPDTAYALDHMRPDMVLLMALGRALVLWDSIEPTEVCGEWELLQRCKGISPYQRQRAGPFRDTDMCPMRHRYGLHLDLQLPRAGNAAVHQRHVAMSCHMHITSGQSRLRQSGASLERWGLSWLTCICLIFSTNLLCHRSG
jgi:hypothetical protein